MTMPYDGRSRLTPAYAQDTLSPSEFETQFCETLIKTLVAYSPGPAMPEGLTHEDARQYHGTFLKYMSFFAWKFPSWLMSIASQCPYQDVRREIIKDCVDEEVGDTDANGLCHVDLLYDEAVECGIPREEIFEAEPTPVILACIHAWENLSRTLGWLGGYAAIAGLEVIQSEPALRARERITGTEATQQYSKDFGGSTFHEKLGLPDGSLKFFALHAYKDRFHGGGELALIVNHANTPQLQHEALWAGRTSVQLMSLHSRELRRIAREAVGLAPAPQLAIA